MKLIKFYQMHKRELSMINLDMQPLNKELVDSEEDSMALVEELEALKIYSVHSLVEEVLDLVDSEEDLVVLREEAM